MAAICVAGRGDVLPKTAADFSLHGKISASPLFYENKVLKKTSCFAQKSQRFPEARPLARRRSTPATRVSRCEKSSRSRIARPLAHAFENNGSGRGYVDPGISDVLGQTWMVFSKLRFPQNAEKQQFFHGGKNCERYRDRHTLVPGAGERA